MLLALVVNPVPRFNATNPPVLVCKTHKDEDTILALCCLSLWLRLKVNQTIEAANRAQELATFNHISDATVYLQPGSALASYVTISDSKTDTLRILGMIKSHAEVMPTYLVQQFTLEADFQGNTIISVTRPPIKTKQEREKREREREERFGSMVLRDHTNDSGNPKRLKLGLQLPTGPVFILYRYSKMFLDE